MEDPPHSSYGVRRYFNTYTQEPTLPPKETLLFINFTLLECTTKPRVLLYTLASWEFMAQPTKISTLLKLRFGWKHTKEWIQDILFQTLCGEGSEWWHGMWFQWDHPWNPVPQLHYVKQFTLDRVIRLGTSNTYDRDPRLLRTAPTQPLTKARHEVEDQKALKEETLWSS